MTCHRTHKIGAVKLTTAIGGVAIRTDEQRHVVVLRRVVNFEDDRYLRIEIIDVETREIWLGIEDQPVNTAGKRLFHEKERFDPAIFVGPGVAQFGPAFVGVLQFQADGYTTSRRTPRDVENVRGNCAHLVAGVYSLNLLSQ